MSNLSTPRLSDFLPDGLVVNEPEKKLHHVFTEADCYALWAAYSSGRPLLLRGAPGTGKSQLAQAIAAQLGWTFVSEVIQGGTELSDLHWYFDAVGRLGEAQVHAGSGDVVGLQQKLNPQNFLSPGAFWWAFDWETAQAQADKYATRLRSSPDTPATCDKKVGGVVLLLDEIDKAEPDLPNGLLETLGQFQFTVPYLDHRTNLSVESPLKSPSRLPTNPIKADPARVLVIITTNEERELPRAFVRRCFVHTLKMNDSTECVGAALDGAEHIEGDSPQPVQQRHQWLMERGRLHFGSAISEQAYFLAAKLLWDDRDSNPHSLYPPGLAEYIDLLTAIQTLDKVEQEQRLRQIARYALQKEVDV